MAQKSLLEKNFELFIDSAETFRQQSEEALVDALHHAALQDHVHQFVLMPPGQV